MRLAAVAVICLTATNVIADEPSVFPHGDSRLWLAGQGNIIAQAHGPFRSPYAATNSFDARPEHAESRVFTLYGTYRTSRLTEVIVDLESAGGRGISNASGLAGFTDLDVVRNPSLGATPYVARAMLHAVIPLSNASEESERTFLSGFKSLPTRRLELRAGKMSLVDFFDVNDVGSDSHLQFMNWTIDNNGAYDYAADTRGYTFGIVGEYHVERWTVRAAVALMPTVANGIHYDKHIRTARSENVEMETRAGKTTARLLLYRNLARMGSYREALAASGVPDITRSRRDGRTKYGFGVNLERELADRVRAFARLGWNDGRNESFAYTEVDGTAEIGGDVKPFRRRPLDKIGLAFVSNGLWNPHRDYLAAGGAGFLLGDGALRYGREQIVETYYNASIAHGIYVAVDVQGIDHPGYNRDRGPILVPSMRLHVDF